MATSIVKYQDITGKEFNSEIEADASNAVLANKAEVDAFVAKHFPVNGDSKRGNPHAGTAAKAIYLWIAASQGEVPAPEVVAE